MVNRRGFCVDGHSNTSMTGREVSSEFYIFSSSSDTVRPTVLATYLLYPAESNL